MWGFIYRHAKSLPLVAGFLFGMVGGIWSYAVDHRLGEELVKLSDAKADIGEQVRTLNSLASEYFIANHQGDLIFVTAHQSDARGDLAQLIYKASLLDRAAPVRNMIGALAIAKQLDYRATADAYEALNAEARANFSLATFSRLKQAETEIIDLGQNRVPVLVKVGFEIDRMISANKQAQKKNGVIGLLSSFVGGFLLMLANLIALGQRNDIREPAPAAAPTPRAPAFAALLSRRSRDHSTV